MSGRVWQCLPLSWIRRRMTLPRCRAGNVKHGCQEQRSWYEIYDVKNPCWQLFLGYLHDTCQCWGFSVPFSLFAVSVLQFLLKVWAESFLACLEGRPNKASGILSGVPSRILGFLDTNQSPASQERSSKLPLEEWVFHQDKRRSFWLEASKI